MENQQHVTDVFNSAGRIRADIDPASIPEGRRPAFVALLAAQTQCDQAESDERAANERVEQCVRIFNIAEAHVPRQSHVELVKQTFNLT